MHQPLEGTRADQTVEGLSAGGHDAQGQAQAGASPQIMELFEQGLARGRKLVEDNPAIAVLGAVSIVAIAVLATKRTTDNGSSVAGLEREIRRLAAKQQAAGMSYANSISDTVSRALQAEPALLEPYLKLASDWVQRAQAGLSDAVSKVTAKS